MINRNNYCAAKEYLRFLDDVHQLDPRSIERYWFYLKYVLIWADAVSIGEVTAIRPTFATFLSTTRRDGDVGTLAPTTLKKVIQTVKRFFTWLKLTYPREYRSLTPAWIDTLRPPRSVPLAPEHTFVTLEEIRQLAAVEVDHTDLALWRDQVGTVMLFLSGMRAGAFGTLPISAVDLAQRTIKQWPSMGVATKNGKAATTYLLDIPEMLAVVEEWDTFIRAQLPPTAMWYTPIISQWGEQSLSPDAPGANRNLAVSKRVRKFFELTDLPYKSPHKFRHGHAVFGLQHARTMADYQAVSTNLMHEDIRVTDSIYARLASDEVKQSITGLTAAAKPTAVADNSLTTFVRTLSPEQLAEALIAIAQQLAH
jgi:integrase